MRSHLTNLPLCLALVFMSTFGCQHLQKISLTPGPTGANQIDTTDADQAQAEDQYPEIREYFRLFAARDQLPNLKAIQDLTNIISARPHSPAAYEAHVVLARYYAQLGDPATENEYRAALQLEDDRGLRLELAYWLEEQGRTESAYVEYESLLSQYPHAFEAMRRVGADPLKVAGDLVKASYYSDALEELRGIDDPDAELIRAQALSGMGRDVEALPLFRRWLEEHSKDSTAIMGLALTLGRMGERDEASFLYETLDTNESFFALAELWENENPARAIGLYLKCSYPIATWEATTLLEKEGRFTETLPLYAELARSQTLWADDAAFRLHVLTGRLHEPAIRAQARQSLIANQPNFLALRLGEQWSPAITLPFRPAGTQIVSKTLALRALGLDDLAHRELIVAAHVDTRPEARAVYAQALFEQGYVLDAQRIAEQTLHEIHEAPLSLWQLAYPQPYKQDVLIAAEKFDLDPLLLWAIMHTESRYDPEAFSRARAQGLMQLMPSTADWVAESAGIPFTPLEVYDTRTNIHLGAWYMSWLLDYFDDDLELAVTAYNGGQGSVNTWNEQVSNREDFFRWIGFGESREYVNRVFTAYHIYQELERLSSSD